MNILIIDYTLLVIFIFRFEVLNSLFETYCLLYGSAIRNILS